MIDKQDMPMSVIILSVLWDYLTTFRLDFSLAPQIESNTRHHYQARKIWLNS